MYFIPNACLHALFWTRFMTSHIVYSKQTRSGEKWLSELFIKESRNLFMILRYVSAIVHEPAIFSAIYSYFWSIPCLCPCFSKDVVYVCFPWPLSTSVSPLQIHTFTWHGNEHLYPETQWFQPHHMTPAVTNQHPATNNCPREVRLGVVDSVWFEFEFKISPSLRFSLSNQLFMS